MDATAAGMASEAFVPTYIADCQGIPAGEVIGDVLLEWGCKALLAGECLMTVGGYVVKGVKLSCQKRARAARREDGAFERVEPGWIKLIRELQQQPPLALPPPADDLASAASSICLGLAIQGTPSPARPNNLLPAMEQVIVDVSELPHQEKIQLFEGAGLLQQQQLAQQQFEQDTHAQTVASIHIGKRPLPPTNHDHDQQNDNDHTTAKIIQALQEEVRYLKNLIQKYTSITINGEPKTPMQIPISTLVQNSTTQLSAVEASQKLTDPLQGANDPYQASLGHENLQNIIHEWVMQVIQTGKWPKSVVIANRITDVIAVVQAEVTRIQNKQIGDQVHEDTNDKVLQTVRRQTFIEQQSNTIQASPISVSSYGSGGDGGSPNERILVNLGVGGQGNGDKDGDRDGDGYGPGGNVEIGNGYDGDSRGGGPRRHEFALVNPRNIIINTFIGRNLVLTHICHPIMP